MNISIKFGIDFAFSYLILTIKNYKNGKSRLQQSRGRSRSSKMES